jgi:hypothetical protein
MKSTFDPQIGVGNYDESYCIEDRDMYLRLLKRQQLGFIEDKVAQYRLHDSNTIGSPALAIRNIIDRAQPLLQFSKASSIPWAERFVARHTALALVAHANRRASSHPSTRATNALLRTYHLLLARPVGELYLRLR